MRRYRQVPRSEADGTFRYRHTWERRSFLSRLGIYVCVFVCVRSWWLIQFCCTPFGNKNVDAFVTLQQNSLARCLSLSVFLFISLPRSISRFFRLSEVGSGVWADNGGSFSTSHFTIPAHTRTQTRSVGIYTCMHMLSRFIIHVELDEWAIAALAGEGLSEQLVCWIWEVCVCTGGSAALRFLLWLFLIIN